MAPRTSWVTQIDTGRSGSPSTPVITPICPQRQRTSRLIIYPVSLNEANVASGRLFDWLQNGEVPTPARDFAVHLNPASSEYCSGRCARSALWFAVGACSRGPATGRVATLSADGTVSADDALLGNPSVCVRGIRVTRLTTVPSRARPPGLPAPRSPLRNMWALRAERRVKAVTRIEPGLVGQHIEDPG
jgi:hypothetical protein